MSSPVEPETGAALAGRYLLEARIGTGGAGVVWQAYDEVLGRRVAVKLLHADLAHDPTSAARFRAEATAAARLTHPNAVMVFDIGRDGGHDYLVMELVDGPDLAALLRDRPLAPSVTAHLGRCVAGALGAAHGRGLVHRDVKPGNVLMTREGVPKVADFGIARAIGDAMARLTLPGSIMGTARYVSPEQLRDEPVDARADVYSLGLVLHEALTGRPPWGEGTISEVAARRLHAELPPVSSFRADLPPGLDAVIVRATRRDHDERHEDGAELASALAPFCGADGQATLAALARTAPARGGAAARRATPGSPTPAGATPAGATPTGATPAGAAIDDPAPSSSPPATSPAPSAPPPAGHDHGTRVLGSHGPSLPPPPARTRPRRRRRRWVLVALAAVVAGVVGILGITDGSLPVTTRPLSDVEVAAAGDHDPLGDLRERPDRLDDALDGDDDTYWQTETYERADLIPPSKDGVGIWFDLGDVHEVERLDLELVTEGTDLEIWAGASVPDGSTPPADWGEQVATVTGAGSSESVRFDATAGRVWLVWFTQLAPVEDGHRAHVADVRVRAR